MLEVSSDISQSFEYLLQSKLFEYANYSELLNISKHHDTNTLGQSKAEHVNLLVFVYLSLWVRTYGIFWRILANLSCTPLLVISSGGRAAEQTIAHFNVVPCLPAMHIHDEPTPGSDTGVRQGWGVLVGVCHVSRPANFFD